MNANHKLEVEPTRKTLACVEKDDQGTYVYDFGPTHINTLIKGEPNNTAVKQNIA